MLKDRATVLHTLRIIGKNKTRHTSEDMGSNCLDVEIPPTVSRPARFCVSHSLFSCEFGVYCECSGVRREKGRRKDSGTDH